MAVEPSSLCKRSILNSMVNKAFLATLDDFQSFVLNLFFFLKITVDYIPMVSPGWFIFVIISVFRLHSYINFRDTNIYRIMIEYYERLNIYKNMVNQ